VAQLIGLKSWLKRRQLNRWILRIEVIMGTMNCKHPVWGNRTYIMGIINVTPDSFSGDGLLDAKDVICAAVEQAGKFLQEGADILDIGGESTRPGAALVSADEEVSRVVPVIAEIKKAHPDALVSVDTYKASVAQEALTAGADWVNDVWGLRADPEMASVVANFHAPVILMHNRSKAGSAEVEEHLGGRYVGADYDDLIGEICGELMESVHLAHKNGISDDCIILDPGIGFGKTVSQNLELMDRLEQVKDLGYPLLVGPSRKSFIGYTLELPPDERIEGTAAAVALAIDRGADILRVHDVRTMTRVARMTDAIVRRNR
jgi:dihydropteroate synthase